MDINPEDFKVQIYNYALETREDIERTLYNLSILILATDHDDLKGPIGETLLSAHRHLRVFSEMFTRVGEVDDKYPEIMDKILKDLTNE